MSDEQKIIVDDDWKAQAQAEKQKLAEEVAQQQQAAQKVPEASITTLVNQLATQSMMALGGMQDPSGSGKVVVDPVAAKYYIDTLVVLKDKTAGNLNDDEATLLEQITSELQMAFVSVMKHLEGQGAAPVSAEGAPQADAPTIETDV